MIYFYALLSTLFEIGGDYLFKINRPWMGIVAYVLGIVPWFLILKDNDLSTSIVIFTSINVIGCVFIGHIFLHENISLQQYIGIACCVIGVILISLNT